MNNKMLAALVELTGLTDKEIAAKLGISVSAYYSKKRGSSEYTRSEIESFTELLDSETVKREIENLRQLRTARDVFFWADRC